MRAKLQNSSYQQRDKDRVFIPAPTQYALFGDRFLNNIVYRAKAPELTKAAERREYEGPGRRSQCHPADQVAHGVLDPPGGEARLHHMNVPTPLFLAIIASVT